MRLGDLFTEAQARVLADLHERDRSERDQGIREPGSLMALSPEVAELMSLLVLQKQARTIVEFGTSHGYSTIHLAAAAERTGGHVHTVDALPEKTALARKNLAAAGLLHRVTLVTSDGTAFVETLPAGVDFVLLDYAVGPFMPAYPGLRERLGAGCLLFADGGPDDYWDTGTGAALRTHLETDPGFVVSTLRLQKTHLIAAWSQSTA